MNWFEIIVSMAGIVFAIGYFPQAYKIIKNRSSENISIATYAIFGICGTIWLIYGIISKSWTIMLGFIFGVIGSWLVFILAIFYRKK